MKLEWDWSDWIEHDGTGCPNSLLGETIEVYWRPEDGDELNWRHGVFLVDALHASCSSWNAATYEGAGVTQHWAGHQFLCGPYWIDHYRIRRLRIADLLPPLTALEPVDG